MNHDQGQLQIDRDNTFASESNFNTPYSHFPMKGFLFFK